MKTVVTKSTVVLWLAAMPAIAVGQNVVSAPASGVRSGVSPLGVAMPPVNSSAPLRAAPLPVDSLARPAISAPPVRATHAMQYGPNVTRPSGSVVVPFGSSGYWYRR